MAIINHRLAYCWLRPMPRTTERLVTADVIMAVSISINLEYLVRLLNDN